MTGSSPTIDRTARDAGADALAAFLEGSISSLQLDARYPERTEDGAVHSIYVAFGPFIDDLSDYYLPKDKTPPEQRAMLGRCVLFLRTNLPFEWPTPLRRLLRHVQRIFGADIASEAGARSVWPFFRIEDYEQHRSLENSFAPPSRP